MFGARHGQARRAARQTKFELQKFVPINCRNDHQRQKLHPELFVCRCQQACKELNCIALVLSHSLHNGGRQGQIPASEPDIVPPAGAPSKLGHLSHQARDHPHDVAQGQGSAAGSREAHITGKAKYRGCQAGSTGDSLRKPNQVPSFPSQTIVHSPRTSQSAASLTLLPRQTPHDLLPKLFGEIRERYQHRPGGYTRVLRTEPKDSYDQAPSAVLELVDGRRDMRFAMTAATVARDRAAGREHTDITLLNVAKVTRFRKEGQAELDGMVERIRQRFGSLSVEGDSGAERLSRGPPRRKDGEADGAKRSRKEGGITSSDSDFPTLV